MWKRQLEFDTDDAEFARGWEAGKVYGALGTRPVMHEALVHEKNREMMIRVAESQGYRLALVREGRSWVKATFLRRGETTEKEGRDDQGQ